MVSFGQTLRKKNPENVLATGRIDEIKDRESQSAGLRLSFIMAWISKKNISKC